MANFTAHVTAVLDTAKAEQKLKNLGKTPIHLTNVTVNARRAATQIQAALNRTPIMLNNIRVNPAGISRQLQTAANAAGRDMSRGIEQGMRQGATRGAREVQRQQQRTARDYQRQRQQEERAFQRELAKANRLLDNNRMDSDIQKLKAQREKIASSDNTKMKGRVDSNIKELEMLQRRMYSNRDTKDPRNLVSNAQEYNRVLERTKNQLGAVNGEMKQFASATQVSKAQAQMTSFLNSGTKAARQYGKSVQDLQRDLTQMAKNGKVPASELKRINDQFVGIQQNAKASGQNVQTLGAKMKGAMGKFAGYLGASTLIYGGIRTVGAGINSVVELDNALVDLRKTSKASANELNEFYYTANDMAKQYGTSSEEIIQSAANWSRLGYSTAKEAETMAKVSSIFKTISPGMEIEKANDGLISAMKAA